MRGTRAGLLIFVVASVAAPAGTSVVAAQDTGAWVRVWGEVLESAADPQVVADAELRSRIEASGLPWRVRDRASGIEMLLVLPGSYERGAAPDDPFDRANERPRHQVELTRPFYLGRYEVTNAQMRRFDPDHDSGPFPRDPSVSLDADEHPVVQVSWEEATAFARHYGLRLPTEAEWELAARAGVETRYPWGNDPDGGEGWGNGFNEAVKARIPEMDWDAFAWHDGWVASAPVGSFRANHWGFYDMFGNVWEYVADSYDEALYARLPGRVSDPFFDNGGARTLRGGGFGNAPRGSGLPYRYGMPPDSRHFGNGFRVARWPYAVAGEPLASPSPTGEGGVVRNSAERRPQGADEWRLIDWAGPESNPRFSPDGEWIAFDAAPTGSPDIFVIRVADGLVRQLTRSPAPDIGPAWSPDGSTIAFRSIRDGVSGIWTVPVAGGDPTPLFVRPGLAARAPDYAPDGRLVMTVLEPDPSRPYGHGTPWLMNADGSGARSLTRHGDEWFGRWAPDGEHVYYFTGRADFIETVNVVSGAIRSITDGRHVGWRPAMSRDGTMLAFVASPNATAWLRTLDDEPLFVKLSERGVDDAPDISPDGELVVFASDRSLGRIVALDPHSGSRTIVAEGVAPLPLADGGLAYLTEDKPPTLMFQDAGAAAPRPWATRLPGILGYDVAPSGRSIVVTTSVGPARGEQRIYLGTIDGGAEPFDTPSGESPVFCDRDDVVMVNRRVGSFRQLFALDLSDGSQRQLTYDRSSKRLTACSSDGRRLSYRYTSGRSGTVVLEREEAGWVKGVQIDAPEGVISPDGARLAYVQTVDGQTDLFIREADGGTVQVTDDALAESQPRWARDGARLYFVVRAPARDLWIRNVPPLERWKPLDGWQE